MSLRLGTDVQEEEATAEGVRLYSVGEVADILGVAPDRVRAWVTAGLVRPLGRDGEWHFDFRQVVAARTVCELAHDGKGINRLRRQLERLKVLAPEAESPLDALPLVEQNGRLLVRVNDHDLTAADGQLHFDFSDDQPAASLRLTTEPKTAAEWHAQGIEQEQRGELEAAAESYRLALQAGGPDAQICFDLGHVLAELGEREAAVERYLQATELNRDFADAWNNLGVLLVELDRPLAACTAFRRALAAEPLNHRSHFNLADALEDLGRHSEAAEHWQSYLRLDPNTERAQYARARLAVAIA